MSRLYDRIMSDGTRAPETADYRRWAAYATGGIGLAITVLIDNVYEYYGKASHKKPLSLLELPNIAPPFPNMFLEYRISRQKLEGYKGQQVRTAAGAFLHAIEVGSDVLEEDERLCIRQCRAHLFRKGIEWEPVRWVLNISVFDCVSGIVIGPLCNYVVPVDQGGRYVGAEILHQHCSDMEAWAITDDWDHSLTIALTDMVVPALLALSFMHCKNVTLTANDADEKLNRARVKRGNKPLSRFYTLDIEPMKRVLKHEGGIEKVGLKQALHICRGHFKDYRERGLFGRNKGLYWWDSQVRGSLEEGAVVKDYKVDAPKLGESE